MMDFFPDIPSWILSISAVLVASFATCAVLVVTQRWHGHFSHDSDLMGAQKIHSAPVPRIGGLGLLIGLAIGGAVGFALNGQTYAVAMVLLLCAVPIFLAGFLEDLTKRVSVKTRLLASFVSPALAVWLLDARLTDVDTPILDLMLQYTALSVLFTCFAVAGMTNSVNIIDGLNGLAAGSVSIMLAGLAAIAWLNGDLLVVKLCAWGVAAMLGFLFLNYPFGRIFLGDSGAYLAGFWVAECGVLLLTRNPEVSTWTVLLACFFPVWETAYSMYRRRMVSHVSSGQPDMGHLHHLIFKRVSTSGMRLLAPVWRRHAVSSGLVWMMVLSCQLTAAVFFSDTRTLALSTLIMAMIYSISYTALSARERSMESTREGEAPASVNG